MITVKELPRREDFYDAAVLRHGFTDYMRDYEIVVGARNGPPNTDVHKYQFVGCVEAHYQSKFSGEVFSKSLSDKFVYSGPDYPNKEDPEGFIWGVRFSDAYPALTYVEGGERAAYWSNLLGWKMHEITLETNVFHLRLVFADVRYAFLGHEPEVAIARDIPLEVSEETSDGDVC